LFGQLIRKIITSQGQGWREGIRKGELLGSPSEWVRKRRKDAAAGAIRREEKEDLGERNKKSVYGGEKHNPSERERRKKSPLLLPEPQVGKGRRRQSAEYGREGSLQLKRWRFRKKEAQGELRQEDQL